MILLRLSDVCRTAEFRGRLGGHYHFLRQTLRISASNILAPSGRTELGKGYYPSKRQRDTNGRAQGYTGVDHVFVFLARGQMLGIPVLIWIFLAVAVAAQLALHYTVVGRNVYAVGGNATASRLAGVPLNRYIIGAYALCGVVAAIAGVLLTARTGSGQPTSGSQGLELQSITAAALGGCSLQGGRGAIVGTVLAVILLGVLANGLVILDVNSFWQDIAQGALLVAAVVIQQRRGGARGVGLPT